MSDAGYLNLDLTVESQGTGYRAAVLSSPAGEARVDDLLLTGFLAATVGEHDPQVIYPGRCGAR